MKTVMDMIAATFSIICLVMIPGMLVFSGTSPAAIIPATLVTTVAIVPASSLSLVRAPTRETARSELGPILLVWTVQALVMATIYALFVALPHFAI